MAWARSSPIEDHQFVPYSEADTWDALTAAVQGHRKMTVKSTDDRIRRIEFVSGSSAMTSGQKFAASVEPGANGTTVRISAIGKLATQGGNEGRGKKLISEVLANLSYCLADKAKVSGSLASVGDKPSLADEITKLASLRDAGALTEAQFESAKNSLLG